MVSKKPFKKPFTIPSSFLSLGSALKEITIAVANHPTTLALSIMAGSALIQTVVLGTIEPGEPKRDRLRHAVETQLGGLYNGTQGITVALAAVPIITSVAGAVAGIANSKASAFKALSSD